MIGKKSVSVEREHLTHLRYNIVSFIVLSLSLARARSLAWRAKFHFPKIAPANGRRIIIFSCITDESTMKRELHGKR